MGMDINTVLIKSISINKQDYLKLIEEYYFGYNDLSSIEGYEILSIDDEDIDCFKIGEEIAKKLNTITISLFSYDSDFAGFQLIDDDIIICVFINHESASSYDYNENDLNVETITKYIDKKYSLRDVYNLINNEYTFAEDGLSELLKMFNISFDEIIF